MLFADVLCGHNWNQMHNVPKLSQLVHGQACQVEEHEKRKCLIYAVVGC